MFPVCKCKELSNVLTSRLCFYVQADIAGFTAWSSQRGKYKDVLWLKLTSTTKTSLTMSSSHSLLQNPLKCSCYWNLCLERLTKSLTNMGSSRSKQPAIVMSESVASLSPERSMPQLQLGLLVKQWSSLRKLLACLKLLWVLIPESKFKILQWSLLYISQLSSAQVYLTNWYYETQPWDENGHP